MLMPGSDPVHKVSIIPRGVGALGYTIQRPTEERYLMTRAELENRMVVLLAAARRRKSSYGHFRPAPRTTCSASPRLLEPSSPATACTTNLATWFMKRNRATTSARSHRSSTSPTPKRRRREIDLAVRAIVQDKLYRRTMDLLRAREVPLLRASARDLLTRETLGEEELAAIRQQAIGG